MRKADIGLIGLAVMGENLARNIASKGYRVAVHNRDVSRVDNFIAKYGTDNFIGIHEYSEFISALKKPRKVILMIKAGKPVDMVIESLMAVLEPGDIIIDGGNSNYQDTMRRNDYVTTKGFLYVGAGISGGEEGALNGPSIMPGGNFSAWNEVKPILTAIAAKTENGEICCDWIGDNGSGHFVKMVHNGIEYGDIQLINEVYHLMRDYLKLSNQEIHDIFTRWNQGVLNSYLIEITADIFSKKEEDQYVIDKILDTAGQKGTGKWTAVSSIEHGVPLTLITESVYSRFISSMKSERVKANKIYNKNIKTFNGDKNKFIEKLEYALFIAKIISYAQGFSLLQSASNAYKWNLDFGNIALLWRGGCIIRSAFLDKIKKAYKVNENLQNLLIDPYFKDIISSKIMDLREIVSEAIIGGIPVPSLSSSIAYFDGYTSDRLPANLLQAQRDYFGAHTYERIDKPRGEYYHTNWTGKGGSTSSTTYDN